MKIIKLDTRYFLARHWFRWYLVSNPYKNRMTWTLLKKATDKS